MNDIDWDNITTRLSFSWPATPLSAQSLEAYRVQLDDLDAAAVMVAVNGFIGENRGTIPPPAAIRARVLDGLASAPQAPSVATPPPSHQAAPTPPPPPASAAGPPVAAPAPPLAPRAGSDPPAATHTSAIAIMPSVSSATTSRGFAIRKTPSVMVAVAAAAVVFISCFMAWISTPFGSVAGTSTDDGKIVLVVSVLGVAMVLLSSSRIAFSVGGVVFGLICIVTFLVDMNDIQSRVSDSGLDGLASVGGGIYLGLIASIVWVIAAAISGLERREPANATPAP